LSHLREAIDSIQKSSDSIVMIAKKLPEETIQWKPAPEVWSIHEILCHVEELLPYWSDEIRRVASTPGVEWGRGHANEARLAAVAASPTRNSKDVIAGVEKVTQHSVGVLNSLREEDLAIESPSRNPRFGVKPMSFVLNHLLVKHMRDHLGQIQRNLDQLAAAAVESGKK